MSAYWVWLSRLKGVGPVNQKRLLDTFKSPRRIYRATEAELRAIPGLRPSIIKAVIAGQCTKLLEQAEAVAEQAAGKGIRLLPFTDPLYPAAAKAVPAAPVILYYRGQLAVNLPGVAIVGSRRCTEYGKMVAAEAATFLANRGIPLISGMAKGIDGYGQTACLRAGGYTLAFLAYGLDQCYPREHASLMERIVAEGATLSAYPPGVPPKKEFFPARNNLITAWSHTVLIVEAGKESGALLTAKYALTNGRQVLAVPNSIYCPESIGTNRLISQGITPYLSPEQLLAEEPTAIAATQNKPKPLQATPNFCLTHNWSVQQENIMRLLYIVPRQMEELALELKTDLTTLLEDLWTLELDGFIRLQGSRVMLTEAGLKTGLSPLSNECKKADHS
ncbi:MAG: hypothetical protein A4E55_01930 [Pelotomaculum sp. PtaU1.Bin035]|nr:MAG: hypothetical protein A4E55_01930 [Pelotomaculum sp. PtaU1.Bin035]